MKKEKRSRFVAYADEFAIRSIEEIEEHRKKITAELEAWREKKRIAWEQGLPLTEEEKRAEAYFAKVHEERMAAMEARKRAKEQKE